MKDLCPLCNGAGSHVTCQNGKLEWWECWPCGGAGVRVQYAPPIIGPGLRKTHSGKNFSR